MNKLKYSKHNEKFLKPNRKYLHSDFTDNEIEEEMKKLKSELYDKNIIKEGALNVFKTQ